MTDRATTPDLADVLTFKINPDADDLGSVTDAIADLIVDRWERRRRERQRNNGLGARAESVEQHTPRGGTD